MTYLPDDPILHEIGEIRSDIITAGKFEDLHRVCRKHLYDPFDQQKPPDVQSAYDALISTLRGINAA
jgi:hypothetical protein